MYNYCTLFDSKYLIRGLAMYESLKLHSKSFHLYVFAFDDLTEKILKEINLPQITVISLGEFENEELLALKPTRTKGEYCWTCTPSTIKYCIEKFKLPFCTYIDADLYFYNDPAILLEEMGNNSVLITPHWYTSLYNQSATNGVYCVQFITFKNTPEGMEVLEWWRRACNNWCFARVENGKFGDQKYLDDWPEKFKGVYVLENKGGGVAPWNVQQYDLINLDELIIKEKASKKTFTLVFYHYHNVRFLKSGEVDLGSYRLPLWIVKNFYTPYLLHIQRIWKNLQKYGYEREFHDRIELRKHWKTLLLKIFTKINILSSFFFFIFNRTFSKSKGKFFSKIRPIIHILIADNNIITLKGKE